MIKLLVDSPGLRIYHGKAEEWAGQEPIDFVFTNPYGPMPRCLRRTPMIIHQWVKNKVAAETWCGNELPFLVSLWNKDQEAFWGANLPFRYPLDLRTYTPVSPGWYPEGLVQDIFEAYLRPGMTVWDGFMGRGTIAKIAQEQSVNYVGVEELSKHIAIAARYLDLEVDV